MGGRVTRVDSASVLSLPSGRPGRVTAAVCNCRTFQSRGICLHTGLDAPVFVPDAVIKSQQYVSENRDRWRKEEKP